MNIKEMIIKQLEFDLLRDVTDCQCDKDDVNYEDQQELKRNLELMINYMKENKM